jgi:hypothetical protein
VTFSPADRLANLKLALTLCVQAVGDSATNEITLDASHADYSNILSTTWQELHEHHFVTHIDRTPFYYLTGLGWVKGLEVAGTLQEPEFQAKAGRLSAILKRYVKARQTETLVSTWQVANDSQLPYGFVYNSIDGKLLEKLFKTKGADWKSLIPAKMLILIPSNFGHEPLDI